MCDAHHLSRDRSEIWTCSICIHRRSDSKKNKRTKRKWVSESKNMNPLNYLKHTIMNIEMSCKSGCTHTRQNASQHIAPAFSADRRTRMGKKKKKQHRLVKMTLSLCAHASPQNCHRIVYIQIYTSSGIFRVKSWRKKSFLDGFKIDGRFFVSPAAAAAAAAY